MESRKKKKVLWFCLVRTPMTSRTVQFSNQPSLTVITGIQYLHFPYPAFSISLLGTTDIAPIRTRHCNHTGFSDSEQPTNQRFVHEVLRHS